VPTDQPPRDLSGASPAPVLAGAEPMSHVAADGAPGLLAVHGFTGSPSSMRPIAAAFAAAGYHVELPRLPGHGTAVDDMLVTGWDDWSAAVDAAYRRLAERTDRVVVSGLSMGGTLSLWTALGHPEVRALVLVNPATRPHGDDVRAMLAEWRDEGMTVVPGGDSDIADPDGVDLSYPGTPVAPLLSLIDDGLTPLADRYGELTMPLLLFTSRQDHVVEPAQSEHLAATYGGPVEHRWLERSYHVATRDHDRDEIVAGALQFAAERAG